MVWRNGSRGIGRQRTRVVELVLVMEALCRGGGVAVRRWLMFGLLGTMTPLMLRHRMTSWRASVLWQAVQNSVPLRSGPDAGTNSPI